MTPEQFLESKDMVGTKLFIDVLTEYASIVSAEKDKEIKYAEKVAYETSVKNANLMAELAAAKERIVELEKEVERLRGILHNFQINHETGKEYFADLDPTIFNNPL